jgi:hypothetical protein
VSRDGSQLAVAGRRGVALYNTLTSRWKLFGDEREEQRVACRGLCWFGRDVVIVAAAVDVADGANAADETTAAAAAADDEPRGCQLCFYPRAQLSNVACLHRMLLPGRREPRFIDCNELFLVLFTRDAFFYQYEVRPEFDGNAKIVGITTHLIHQVCRHFFFFFFFAMRCGVFEYLTKI